MSGGHYMKNNKPEINPFFLDESSEDGQKNDEGLREIDDTRDGEHLLT